MTTDVERLAAAIEEQSQAVKAHVDACARHTEAVMMLVHAVAALLGEETGQPVQADTVPDDRLSTLDG